jgi:hypothetical protein
MNLQDRVDYRWMPKSERNCFVHPYLHGTIWWEYSSFACYLLPMQEAGFPNARFVDFEDAQNYMRDNQHLAAEADQAEVKQY